jgi:CheY-like chemotaxis protein
MPPLDNGRPVLVVDDNDEVRVGLKALLESAGFAVTDVPGGREALRAIRSGAVCPCLVLLDLLMPLFDGWDVLAELNSDTDLAAIPVIVLSAHPLARLAKNAGAVAVLSKPMDPATLIGAVDRHARYAAESSS